MSFILTMLVAVAIFRLMDKNHDKQARMARDLRKIKENTYTNRR